MPRRMRRFDREKAARPLTAWARGYWRAGIAALLAHLTDQQLWPQLRRQARLAKATRVDADLIDAVLNGLRWLGDEEPIRRAMQVFGHQTFEDAAKVALSNIGLGADFSLKNPEIAAALQSRGEQGVLATRARMKEAMAHIIDSVHDLGESPTSPSFLAGLKKELGVDAAWKAQRFAVTEVGIAAETAQHEVFLQNGVEHKQWNITGRDTRPTHEALQGKAVEIRDVFEVGGHRAKHPLDPALPPDETNNCHCWLSPVVDDGWTPAGRVWRGE